MVIKQFWYLIIITIAGFVMERYNIFGEFFMEVREIDRYFFDLYERKRLEY